MAADQEARRGRRRPPPTNLEPARVGAHRPYHRAGARGGGLAAISLFYKLAYRLGITPWEEGERDPATRWKAISLFDQAQQGRQPPYGRALDLGCGSGAWAVELARRGWEVTGIDIVGRALDRARRRALEAGVDLNLVEGDVTALRAAGVGDGYRFIWDFGTVHGLDAEQRRRVGREVTAVSAPDASLAMLAWEPGRRGPLPRGASRGEIEAAYEGWRLVEDEPADVSGPDVPRPVRKARPHWYRLVRGGPPA